MREVAAFATIFIEVAKNSRTSCVIPVHIRGYLKSF